jgi:hypothetical protein
MGERAHDDASDDELAEMCGIVRAALEAGALGFSTGRTAGHRDVRGNPVLGTFAPEDELTALLGVMDEVVPTCSRSSPRACAAGSPATPPAPWRPSSTGWYAGVRPPSG